MVSSEDVSVEDVRRALLQVRKQFDAVHAEADQKEARLKAVRESIQAADRLHHQKSDEVGHHDDKVRIFKQQLKDTQAQIMETQTSKKVYEHMLARIQREQSILKQKMLALDHHLGRKRRDLHRQVAVRDRVNADRMQSVRALEVLSDDANAERMAVKKASAEMEAELEGRKEMNRRKARFEGWRHEVALRSANEAFNASAGKLRKLYAIEKLSGNCLQKITFEQVERSQSTEDGFQKIREVTGLTDVMDIVHKFLNRDIEHEQLKGSVKDAEVRLEALRQDFEAFKRDTEGITFAESSDADGVIYKDIGKAEQLLNEATQEHEVGRQRLQRTTLQIENMKRWAAKMGESLSVIDDLPKVEKPLELLPFVKKLEFVLQHFLERVSQDISSGKINRRNLLQVLDKEHQNYTKTLADKEFLKLNCHVPPTADGPARSNSRQGNAVDDYSFAEDRARHRKESEDRIRMGEHNNKRGKPPRS